MSQAIVDKLYDGLTPEGSIIDAAWEIDDKHNYYRCANSYHVMDDDGFYVGWADFTVIIPKKAPHDFRLHFHGRRASYLDRRYRLREYLEDTFAHLLGEIFPPTQALENANTLKILLSKLIFLPWIYVKCIDC